jgi:hypothetical protein
MTCTEWLIDWLIDWVVALLLTLQEDNALLVISYPDRATEPGRQGRPT